MGNGEVATLQNQQTSGSLINMNDAADEMAIRLAEMKAKIDMVQKFIKGVMKKDLDYGEIPFTDNRTLFQPGADKLNDLYGYARYITSKDENKNYKTGHYDVTVRIQLKHKSTGIVVGEGEGSCSTYESKYRYRWVYEREIPNGIAKESLVSKTFVNKKTGKEYTKYRVENQDLMDVWNTVLKMAIKRAYVAATLAATGLSGIFNQDEEEFEAWIEGEADSGKEKLEKKRSVAHASDERSSFVPPSNGDSKITNSQYGKIIGDAKRKGVEEDGIKTIVMYVKKKAINELSKTEASAVIDFISKSSEEELQDLILESSLPPEGEEI